MPTARMRHTVTESDAVAAALAAAERRWPGTPRGQLLVRLVEAGHRAIEDEREAARGRWLAAVQAASGSMTGVYRDDEHERLREDWPA